MPRQLAKALEKIVEEQGIPMASPEDAPYLKAYICDGVHLDTALPKTELDRRMRNARKVVAVYSDGTREVQKDGSKS
jgi:hypothetical protein